MKWSANRWKRVVLVVCALGLWFFTQSLLGSRPMAEGSPLAGQILSEGDGLFLATEAGHQALRDQPALADGLLITSSIFIDLLAIYLIASSIFGSTMRPFLALLMLFSLRQICQMLSPLPAPAGMIWHDPGFPSLLVTYQVANDFFFSGHTAIACLGAIELARRGSLWWIPALLVALFEMSAVILLRAHYTMDVYTGAVTAGLVAIIAAWIAPKVDSYLSTDPHPLG